MPLPAITKYGAKQCQCKCKRTGLPCQNLAAHGCISCRMHGAHKSRNTLKGKVHSNYKHGLDTKGAIAERKKKFKELGEIAISLGIKLNCSL